MLVIFNKREEEQIILSVKFVVGKTVQVKKKTQVIFLMFRGKDPRKECTLMKNLIEQTTFQKLRIFFKSFGLPYLT